MKVDNLDGTMGIGIPDDSFGPNDPGVRTVASGQAFTAEHEAAVYAAGAEAERAHAQHVTPPVPEDEDPPPPPPKKLVHRRPLWVFIQIDRLDPNPSDGEPLSPVYMAYRCAGVEEVRKHLLDHKIDAADIDKRAIIFRADPVEVKIKTQLLIKF